MRVAVIAVVLGIALVSSPADAQLGLIEPEVDAGAKDGQVEIGARRSGERGGASGSSDTPAPTNDGDGQRQELLPYPFTLPDGRICIRFLPPLPFVPAPLTIAECDQIIGQVSPVAWVEEYLERNGPDRPAPSFVPSFGLTGERMFLRTEAPVEWLRRVDDTPFGPLELTGGAVVVVDWGDGTDPTVHTVSGEPWPDGEITHVWQVVGIYDVTVSYEWTIDWAFAGDSGTLVLTLTDTLADYPVEQLQPVIRRP